MKDKIIQDKLKESFNTFKDNLAIEYGNSVLTYAELDRRANCIANWILEKGIKKETFIGILMDDRAAFITVMIGILKAGCAFVPLDPSYPQNRIEIMIAAVETRMIFSDKTNIRRLVTSDIIKNENIEFVSVDDVWSTKAKEVRGFDNSFHVGYFPGDRVYIYFTSGTTGKPKAVVGKNKSLLHYIEWEINTFTIDEHIRISQFSNIGFDAFLKETFVALLSGGTLCIPADVKVILNSEEFIDWIERSGIGLIHCVPSLFRLLNSRQLTGKNLKSLKLVLLSGETIYPLELRNWYDKLGERIQLVNLYGTTETTILKTYYPINKSDVNKQRIPIGKPIKGARIIILNRNMKICNRGVVGEIYIRTPYRTFGYYNDEQLNRDRFIPNPFSNNNKPDDLIYKTGDLGRTLPDGDIEFLGRIDRQVKIRGIRVELEEIESVMMSHFSIKEAVLIKKEISAANRILVGFITRRNGNETDGEALILQLKQYLAKRLPDYMVPAKIVEIKEIPRKPNGKVEFDCLAKLVKHETPGYLPPRDEIEGRVLQLWSEILKTENIKISVNSSFFELGGNSLNIVSLISKIHREFNVKIPMEEMFINDTIEKQAELVKKADSDIYSPIPAAEEKEYYVMSSAQKRLYILQQSDLTSTSYNITPVVILAGELNRDRLEKAFRKLLKRHESLRTSFETIGEKFIQIIHDEIELEIEYFEVGEHEIAGIVAVFRRSFDLSKAPLLRLGIIKLAKEKHILMVDMHHIITDGISMGILMKELMIIFAGKPLPELKHQYKDYIDWQCSEMISNKIEKQEEHWLKEFEGEISALNIFADYPRPETRSFEGNSIKCELDGDQWQALKNLAINWGTTPFVVLLAIFNVLLFKVSGNRDIIVGTSSAGRNHPDLESIMGMFVNTLALRNYPTGEIRFKDFVKEVKQRTLKAFENQDYQFEELVEKLGTNKDRSRNPLFDVLILFQNMDIPKLKIPGLELNPYEPPNNTSKFDLTLWGTEVDEQFIFGFEYCTKLFKSESVERLIRFFKAIVSSVLEDTGKKLSDIEIISHEEKVRLLSQFTDEL